MSNLDLISRALYLICQDVKAEYGTRDLISTLIGVALDLHIDERLLSELVEMKRRSRNAQNTIQSEYLDTTESEYIVEDAANAGKYGYHVAKRHLAAVARIRELEQK